MLTGYYKYEATLRDLNSKRYSLLDIKKVVPKEIIEEIADLKYSMDRINVEEVLLK